MMLSIMAGIVVLVTIGMSVVLLGMGFDNIPVVEYPEPTYFLLMAVMVLLIGLTLVGLAILIELRSR